MDLWRPPTDQPHLLEWWRPLFLASRAARDARIAWPIHPDEMVLVGRVDRSSRPAVWVYRHPAARGELYVDGTGQPFKFTRTPNAKSYGRFTAVDIRTAVWKAGLPEVVEPIWYDDPWPSQSHGRYADPLPDTDDLEQPAPLPPPEGDAPRRRGHLTVHDGGRALTG